MAKKLSDLAAGSLIKDTGATYYGAPIVWRVMEHGHTGDPDGSTAVIADKIISIKAFDAKEPNNSNSSRQSYGNNRYLYSNLLQWLNSDAEAGKWYSAQHSADQAPSSTSYVSYNPYSDEAGFLNGFSEQMKAALLTVTKRTAKNTVTDGGGYEDVSSKVFLLSKTEVGHSNENSIEEGSLYTIFTDNASRIAYPTAEAAAHSTYSVSATSAWYWWLRTPYASSANGVRSVYTDGTSNYRIAYNGYYGVRPALCILSSISLSDEPDADGAYMIQWNSAPTIATEGEDLGDRNTPFEIKFSITDPDGDDVSASVKLDGDTVWSAEKTEQGTDITCAITGVMLAGLAIGSHTITIEAEDAVGNASSTSMTFAKTESPIAISGSDGDLGTLWITPEYAYTVADIGGSEITVTEYLDDEEVRTVEQAQDAGEITFDFTEFAELSDEESHTATIRAVNADGAEAYRTITFTKIPDRLQFTSKPIATDAAARRVIVTLNYDKTGNPDVTVEACNDAKAASPHWEDISGAFAARKAYTFANQPESGFGVSVRITIKKNADTPRVYCSGFGISFD
jgi:hypothetical protein